MTETRASQDPIFIVGASRSGTALLRAILNRHPRAHLATETHYFDDLRPKLAGKETSSLTPEEARICEDYFLALGHRPYGHRGEPERSSIPRERVRELAERIGPGADAYFEAFCRLHCDAKPEVRWGEKTPRHLFRLRDIFQRYPGAQVICMVRDPRAVIASYRDWRNQGGFDFEADPGHEEVLELEHDRTRQSYHIIILSLLWRGGLATAQEAMDRYGHEHVRIQRYEDLVQKPEREVRAIASWLGLEYQESMLDVPVHNSTFSRFDPHGGVRREALARWRSKLSNAEVSVVESCCGRRMVRAGYELERIRVYPWVILGPWLTLPFAVLRALRANRERITNVPAYIWWRLRPAFRLRPRGQAPGR